MNYDNMIRDDLIAEIEALKSTMNKRISKEVQKHLDKIKEESKFLKEIVLKIATAEHDEAVHLIQHSKSKLFWLSSCIPWDVQYHAQKLNEAIKAYKKAQ